MANASETPVHLAEPPSVNYETARGTLVYRLSELVFGSILAAYILGFATFGATALTQLNLPGFIDPSNIGGQSLVFPITKILSFALISTTYAYLTAAMYLQYHIGILTMPTAAVERSPTDFAIAVSQALLFGLSMFTPQFHFLAVAAILLTTITRQDREFRALASHFMRQLSLHLPTHLVNPATAAENTQAEIDLLKSVRTTIIESKMEGWRPVRSPTRTGVYLLILIGIVAVLAPWILLSLHIQVSDVSMNLFYGGATLVLCVLVLKGTLGTMKQGSQFLNDKAALDKLNQKYLELEKALLKLI